MQTNNIQAIVTKKVIYEVKFTGTPSKETRDTLRRAGLDFRNGQWASHFSDGGLMTEAEAVTFFGQMLTVADQNAA